MPGPPTASIVIPTHARPDYLEVTLASVMEQARVAGAEVLVVADGADAATEAVARRHAARLVALERPGDSTRHATSVCAERTPISSCCSTTMYGWTPTG